MAAANMNLKHKHKPMLMMIKEKMKKDCAAESEEEELPAPEDDKRKRHATAAAKTKAADASLMKTCQAEKCSADLTDAKPYHRRHKVCEHHAKAQVALVAGIRQRFCQQCSRFHEVSEFDEAKRSCRRRLAGHNERRRKNPAEQAEGSGSSRNKGGGNAAASAQMKDMVCGQVDDRGRIQMTVQENASYKHFHVR